MAENRCAGPVGRRGFLRAGLAGFASLSLPGLLRLHAQEGTRPKTAVILVWLRGGASHLETYDPKPDAPSEIRGVFGAAPTRVSGMRVSELLPLHAKISDKFTLVRSMTHTGDPDVQDKPKPVYPDRMTVANLIRADRERPLPNYVGVNPVERYDGFQIAGSAYVSSSYGPFVVTGDPNDPRFEVPNIVLKDSAQADRLTGRVGLKQRLDGLARAMDRSDMMTSMDAFEAQALQLLTSPRARHAFDLSREPDSVRDRYGRHAWGQQCLMARRLVEAAVEITPRPSTGRCADASGTGTITPSTTTSSTR
jgi:hypothetical protein